MYPRAGHGPSSNSSRTSVASLIAALAATALLPVAACAQDVPKVRIDHLSVPEFVGPAAGASQIRATYAIRPTDGLGSRGTPQHRFFLRESIEYRNGAGLLVRTQALERELLPPIVPNAAGVALVDLAAPFDGLDNRGVRLPDGGYTLKVSGSVVRVKILPPGAALAPPGFVLVIGSDTRAAATILDATPPALAATPARRLFHALAVELRLTFSDLASGVVLASLAATANGRDASAFLSDVTPTSARLVVTDAAFLHEGDNVFTFGISDRAGNRTTIEVTVRILIPHHIITAPMPAVVRTRARTPLGASVYNVDGLPVPGVGVCAARAAGTLAFEGTAEGSVNLVTDEAGQVTVAAFPGFGTNRVAVSLPEFPAVAAVEVAVRGAAQFRIGLTPAGPIEAGSTRSLTLLAIDANSAPITDYSGISDVHTTDARSLLNHFSVAFDGSEGGTITAEYAAFFVTAGTQSITANDVLDPGLVSTLDGIVVVPGPPARFLAVSGTIWATVIVGATPPPAVVRLVDRFDNPIAGWQVEATVSAAGAADTVYTATTDGQGTAQMDLPAFATPAVRMVTLRAAGTDLAPFEYSILVFAAQAVGTVGATGGEVTVSDSASPAFGARLVVPAGSVAANLSFGISALPASAAGLPAVPAGLSPIGSAIDFGPAGAPLAGPITLVIPYREADIPAGVAETALVLLRLDLATGTWMQAAGAIQDTMANTFTVVVQDLTGIGFEVCTSEAPPSMPAVHLRILGGDNQRGVVTKCAGAALLVQALDENDAPIAGEPIEFAVTSGGGAVVDAQGFSRVTDASGTAGVHYIFGADAGTDSVQASLPAWRSAEPVTFTETGSYPTVALEGVVSGVYTARVLGEPGNAPLGVTVTDPSGRPLYNTPLQLDGSESKVYIIPTIEPANYGTTHFEVIPLENTHATLRLPEFPRFWYRGSLLSEVTFRVEAPNVQEPGKPWYAQGPSWSIPSIVSKGQGQVAMAWEPLDPVVLDLTLFRWNAKQHFGSDGMPGEFRGFWLVLNVGNFFLPDAYPNSPEFKVTLKRLTAPGSIGSMAIAVDAEVGYSSYPGAVPTGSGVSGGPSDLTLDFGQQVQIHGPADFYWSDGTPGFYAHGDSYSYNARIGFGLPEIRIVDADTLAPVVGLPNQILGELDLANPGAIPAVRAQIRVPKFYRGGADSTVNVWAFDPCSEPLPQDQLLPPVTQSVRTHLASNVSDRYNVYLSDRIVTTRDAGAEELPSSAGTVFQRIGGKLLLSTAGLIAFGFAPANVEILSPPRPPKNDLVHAPDPNHVPQPPDRDSRVNGRINLSEGDTLDVRYFPSSATPLESLPVVSVDELPLEDELAPPANSVVPVASSEFPSGSGPLDAAALQRRGFKFSPQVPAGHEYVDFRLVVNRTPPGQNAGLDELPIRIGRKLKVIDANVWINTDSTGTQPLVSLERVMRDLRRAEEIWKQASISFDLAHVLVFSSSDKLNTDLSGTPDEIFDKIQALVGRRPDSRKLNIFYVEQILKGRARGLSVPLNRAIEMGLAPGTLVACIAQGDDPPRPETLAHECGHLLAQDAQPPKGLQDIGDDTDDSKFRVNLMFDNRRQGMALHDNLMHRDYWLMPPYTVDLPPPGENQVTLCRRCRLLR